MTHERKAQLGDAADARERVEDLKIIFKDIRERLKVAIAAIGPDHPFNANPLKSKLAELQSAHLAIVQAEEAFHAKFGQGPADDRISIDEIKDQIGRALDRIRDAGSSGGISE